MTITKARGFIGEFSDFILDNIPTTPEWAEDISTFLLSVAAGSEKYVLTKMGPLRMNVWFLTIGPSGLAYKSTPINYFVYPVMTSLTEIIGQPTIVPSSFSAEGLIEYLSKVCSQGGIVRDEFTTVFKQMRKDYIADIMEVLSFLYDGTMLKRYTRKTKMEEVKNSYVCLLAATTPYLYRIMDSSFFIQGTGNRIMFEVSNVGEGDREENDDYESWVGYNSRDKAMRDEKCEEYAKLLGGVFKSPVKAMLFSEDSFGQWIEFNKENKDKIREIYSKEQTSIEATYMARLAEHALKLSGLHRLSTVIQTIGKTSLPELITDETDMEWAIQKTKRHHRCFKDMLSQWNKSGPTLRFLSDEAIKNKFLTTLADHGGRMSSTDFQRALSVYGKRFQYWIEAFSKAGLICGEEVMGDKGRKKVEYYLPKS